MKVLCTLLQNIVNDPSEAKFHKVKLSNKRISETVVRNMECMNLLEVLGFEQKEDVLSQDQGLQVMLQIDQQHVLDNYHKLSSVYSILKELTATQSIKSLTKHFKNPELEAAATPSPSQPPSSSLSKSKQISKMANTQQNVRSKLLEAQFEREGRRMNHPELLQQ